MKHIAPVRLFVTCVALVAALGALGASTAAAAVPQRVAPTIDGIDQLVAFGSDRALFAATDAASGAEPWVSDGTTAGTVQLADVTPGPDPSEPDQFTADGAHAFFTADSPGEGRELWVTDGTPGGTHLVADVRPGPTGSEPSYLTVAHVTGRLFFTADDGTNGRELWSVAADGSGASMAADLVVGPTSSSPLSLTDVGSGIVFDGRTPTTTSPRVMRSDGTPGGTAVLDAAPGSLDDVIALPGTSVVTMGLNTGSEAFATDGTAAGTHLLEQSPHHTSGAHARVGDRAVFFAAGDGLWVTDGTATGTHAEPTPFVEVDHLVAYGGRLVAGADDGVHGFEPWSSSATLDSWTLVADIVPGGGSSYPAGFVHVGSHLAFGADDGVHGSEPWVTDGDAATTRLLVDATPGPSGLRWSFDEGDLTPTPSQLYISVVGDSVQTAYRLLQSDGTTGGTVQLVDTFQTNSHARLGARLLLSANTFEATGGLFTLDGADAAGGGGTTSAPPPAPPSTPATPAPVPPPVAAVVRAGRALFVKLGRPVVKKSKTGALVATPGIALGCERTALAKCALTLTFTTTVKQVVKGHLRSVVVTLGSGRFTIKPGDKLAATFTLNAKGAALLRQKGALGVVAHGVGTAPKATTTTFTGNVTLRAPK